MTDALLDLIDLWFFRCDVRGHELIAYLVGAWAALYPSMREGPMGNMVYPWSARTTEAEWEWLRTNMPRRYEEWVDRQWPWDDPATLATQPTGGPR
jgi:Zn/Cd-binding protein ZinT